MSIHPAAVPRTHDPSAAPKALLQLSAARGTLALELATPFTLGPLVLSRLVTSLDDLDFPVDLSGGVARFRHRRGSLQHLVVDARLAELASFLEPKARSALNSPQLKLSLLPADYGLTVGVHDETFALAFTALFAPDDDTLRFVVTDARGVGVRLPHHGVALRLARTLCGPKAERQGSIVLMDRPLTRLMREALLDAGARLPSCQGVRFEWHDTDQGLQLVASRSAGEGVPPHHVVRGVELARIARLGDDALVDGRLEDARAAYLSSLEAAPRHPALVLRIAELDNLMGNNPEAALASVVEAMPAVDGGLIAAHLLQEVGDRQAALVAARRAAEGESYSPLAARILALCAQYTDDHHEQLIALDEAIARCPSCPSVRRQRVRARLAFGHFDDATSDLSQLEASARGAPARFDVCLEAGELLMEARSHQAARMFFERALRYAPRSAQASVGLARAFLALGDAKRGLALLSRAVGLLETGDPESPALVLDLASALAEHARDLPAAIYHARSIPFGLRETVAARALEGRWRHRLDDRVGATLAYAQAREAAAQLPPDTLSDSAPWLEEAAHFELDVTGDPVAAKRHAEMALRGRPHDPALQALFRRAAAVQQQQVRADHVPVPPTPTPDEPPAAADASPRTQPPDAAPATIPPPQDDPQDDEVAREQRIDTLTDVIRANPNDQSAVRELCTLLERAGRHLDLLALVSARLEESADQDLIADLQTARRRALHALVESARAEGRPDEAEMYEMVLGELDEI